MDALSSASWKQSKVVCGTTVNARETENTLNVGSERTSVQDKSRDCGVNATSFPGSFPKCTREILMEEKPGSFWWARWMGDIPEKERKMRLAGMKRSKQ